MANSAWGIDLGNRALKAIKLTHDGERLRVEDFDLVEYEQILSNAGDNKESILQRRWRRSCSATIRAARRSA